MPSAESFDVAVVGGGTAGVAAALAASRVGARTLLVEKGSRLGGNAAHARVHTICGLYLARDRRPSDAPTPPEMAHAGFPREFAEGLARAGAAGPATWAGRVAVLPTAPDRLAAFAETLCAEAKGVSLWKGAALEAAELAGARGGGSRLDLARGPERIAIDARIVLDTSGDGAVAHAGGAEWGMSAPDELQAASYIVTLSGVDPEPLEGLGRLKVSHAVAGAARFGDLPRHCESVSLRPALEPGQVHLTLNVPKLGDRPFAPLDPEYRRRLEALAHRAASEIVAFLRATRPEFEGARVSAWPRQIGVRESRRIRGRDEVSAADVLEGRRPDDEVALSVWPIELWSDHRRARFSEPKGPCGIPLGALVSRSHPSLGMAGRCLSASHDALGALRVIGTALATGEAIGVAAGLAADAGSSLAAVSPTDVRRAILRIAEGEQGP